MLFWIISAFLTVAVAVALLLPLLKGAGSAPIDDAGEAAVYRDQLKELERDKAQGLISAEDAGYARAEIGRRLLAVSNEAVDASGRSGAKGLNLLAQAFVILCVPAVGLGLYLKTGSPDMPAAPLAARLENPGNNIELLVAKVERHLAENPNDGAGWDVLAPIYFKMQRLGDAELAYRNAIRLAGTSPTRMNGLGEVLIAGNDGIITEDARSAFEEALRLDPWDPRAQFYLALALEQAGKNADALGAFQALAKASPADAPWLPLVQQHIAANSGGAPVAGLPAQGSAKAPGNPTQRDINAAAGMSATDRNAMIRGMVEGLDAKLKDDPNNFEGWMRLVRSYAMLQEKDKAIAALKAGLAAFPPEKDEGKQLIAMGRELGLPVEEALK
ncbi:MULTISPECIES: c-type cytochrome biogenesis protein CcmI [Alphaproteobacteria]|uniref:C-type cytochrome biogenesis protein CcmI n=2 Tax=Alphaproteobacteria TaxID=28211 RepID=A0A512HG17_9HYPH|nr:MULTISPECIES: c-type cytochrome biogenesis protein CcmI [Alphaproteobacteria]GEO84394.1 c-type cytochrome biogenesis protein CcmI [Ciceribacter naphthalenivorans]GLR22357.1 c-type cytochrome biogenesis protein CcmI [Ciceribacter naphthalenivorans]GLT05213.1 c-type cytochrome biogenesis protein CcmI [Sphingomonas psychrolutea]